MAVALIVGVLTIAGIIGWGPWRMMLRAEADKAHSKIVEDEDRREVSADKMHEATLERIRANQEELKEQRKSLDTKYDKLDRRLWRILEEVRK